MLYCMECGGRNIHVAVWINANTGEHIGEARDDDYCDDCGDETRTTEDRREAAAARLARREAAPCKCGSPDRGDTREEHGPDACYLLDEFDRGVVVR